MDFWRHCRTLDPFVAGGWRSEAGCSLTAVHFYEKLGYAFKNGVTVPDRGGLVRMEKQKGV